MFSFVYLLSYENITCSLELVISLNMKGGEKFAKISHYLIRIQARQISTLPDTGIEINILAMAKVLMFPKVIKNVFCFINSI